MSYNNAWLHRELLRKDGIEVAPECDPLIKVHKNKHKYLIYAPTPQEYIVTVDVVQKVIELGGNTISYPTNWCSASEEAILFGKSKGVEIIPHGRLFALLST